MVDIHSHILYGIDDGARTLSDSLAMLEIASASGTGDIVATPHSDLRFRFDIAKAESLIDELKQHTGDKIRIHRGCDFHLHYDNIVDCLRRPEIYTINGKGYLLVEFAETIVPNAMGSVLADMAGQGITPVITHPERNHQLMSRDMQLLEWVRGGCLIQITASSLTGLFGDRAKENCRKLMDRNMVHFVASDAHDREYRTPDMRTAFDAVASNYGQEKAALLFEENPRKTLTGEEIDIEEPAEAPRRKAWYQFW